MVTCALLNACSSSGSSGPTTSTTLVGVVANSSESGSLTVTIASGTLARALSTGSKFALFNVVTPAYASVTSAVNATGTLKIQGGASNTLTGTYDSGTHSLSLSGGGYTFTGTYSNGVLSGTFTNPQGLSGGFSMQSGSTTSVLVYCGTFAGDDHGYFNLAINLTTNVGSGIAVTSTNLLVSATVTVSGSSISGTTANGGTFAGTFNGTNQSNVSGTRHNGAGGFVGTFTGALCS